MSTIVNHASKHRGFALHRGFTLIEMLVVVTILGIILAITLPAVQKSRESMRKIHCSNNLRQVGLAIAGYTADYNTFPMGSGVPDYRSLSNPTIIEKHKQYSTFTYVLPYIEQSALYNSINFNAEQLDIFLFESNGYVGISNNTTSFNVKLSVLNCPTDRIDRSGFGSCNYRINLGAERWPTSSIGKFNGPVSSYQNSPIASVTDGMSNTVLASERCVSKDVSGYVDSAYDVIVGGLGAESTLAQARTSCVMVNYNQASVYHISGLSWSVGTLDHTCYNHIFTPNFINSDCVLPISNPVAGIFSARSYHDGGVNVVMSDGSSRFVKNSIKTEIWSALGTKAGNEVVSNSDF